MFIFGVVLVASIVSFWILSPLFGAVLMIGAVGGLMWAMVPGLVERFTGWLSVGR